MAVLRNQFGEPTNWAAEIEQAELEARASLGDYTANIDPKTIIKDARFLADVREFYWQRDGKTFATDDDLVDYFYSDRNWRELNVASQVRDVADVVSMSDDQRSRMARIQKVWGALPSFWAEGGRGVEALADIAPAVILDPTNLIPGGAAAKSAQAGILAGKTAGKAIAQGVGKAAAVDTAVNAGVAGGADALTQARDLELGIQDEFSAGRVAGAAAAGGVLGAGVGAAVGVPGAVAGVRQAEQELAGRAAAATDIDADIASGVAAGEQSRIDDAQAQGDLLPLPRQGQEPDYSLPPGIKLPEGVNPDDFDRFELVPDRFGRQQIVGIKGANSTTLGYAPSAQAQTVEGKVSELEDIIRQAVADGNPQPEELARLQQEYTTLLKVKQFPITKVATEEKIAALTAEGKVEEAAALRMDLFQQEALYNRITRDPTQLELDPLVPPAPGAEATPGVSAGAGEATPGAAPAEGAAAPAEPATEAATAAAPATPEAPAAAASEATPESATKSAKPKKMSKAAAVRELVAAGFAQGNARKMVKEAGDTDLTAFVETAKQQTAAQNALVEALEMLGPDGATNRAAVEAILEARGFAAQKDAIMARYDELMTQHVTRLESDLGENQTTFVENLVALMREKIAREEPNIEPVQLEARIAAFKLQLQQKLAGGADTAPAPVAPKDPTASRLGKEDVQNMVIDRMPSWMRKGEFIGKSPERTVGMDAIRAEARRRAGGGASDSTRKNLGPFEVTWGKVGEETFTVGATRTADGQRVKPGDRAWYDPKTDKLYADPENIPGLSGPKKPATEIAPAPATDPKQAAIAKAIADFKKHGDIQRMVAEIQAIEAGTLPAAQTKAPDGSPSSGEVAANKTDVTNSKSGAKQPKQAQALDKNVQALDKPTTPIATPDGRVLAVQRKSNPADIRVASAAQAANGDPRALIGKGNPEDWIVGHVPQGSRSGKVRPDDFSGAAAKEAPETPKGPRQMVNSNELRDIPVNLPGYRNAGEVYRDIIKLEARDWPVSRGELSARIEKLRMLYAALPEFQLPRASRSSALNALHDIFTNAGIPPEEIIAARDFLRRLGGNPDEAPVIDELPLGVNARGAFNLDTGKVELNPLKIGNGIKPAVTTLYHEVAHWAYLNVLSVEDRLKFWKIAEKYVGKAGQRQQMLAVMQVENLRGNAASSAQEFFANQFEQWVASSGRMPGDQTLWRRIAKVVDGLISAFFAKERVDPELEELFLKIMPDEVSKPRRALPTVEPRTAVGQDALGALQVLESSRVLLERGLNTLQPSAMEKGLTDALRAVAQAASNERLSPAVRELLSEIASKHYEKLSDARAYPKMGTGGLPEIKDTRVLKLTEAGNDLVDDLHYLNTDLHKLFIDAEKGSAPLPITGPRPATTRVGEVAKANLDRIKDARELMHSAILSGDVGRIGDDMRQVALTLKDLSTLGMLRWLRRAASNEAEKATHQPVGKTITDIYTEILDMTGGPDGLEGKVGTYALDDAAVDKLTNLAADIDDLLNRAEQRLVNKFKDAEGFHPLTGELAKRNPISHRFRRLHKRKKMADTSAQTAARAVAEVKTKPRAERAAKAGKSSEQPAAQSPMAVSDRKLIAEIKKHGINSERSQQLAIELERRIKAQPFPTEPVKVPYDIFKMGRDELRSALTEALVNGKNDVADQVAYEMQRRHMKKMIAPRNAGTLRAIRNEVDANAGVPTDDGIPYHATENVKEMLRYITHRDPEVQTTARTLLYRMLNLMGKDVRGQLDEVNVLSFADIVKLTGGDEVLEGGVAAFADFRQPEYAYLRTQLRKFSIGLTKGNTQPVDVIHEIGHMAYRISLSADERRIVREAFERDLADGSELAQWAARTYSDLSPAAQADEWFSEGFARYAAERVARGDVWGGRDLSKVKLRGRLGQFLDRVVEAVAYITNGLIGRQSVKQMYRRLTFYGDMLDLNRLDAPWYEAFGARADVPVQVADDFARDVMASRKGEQIDSILAFTSNGLGARDGQPLVWFHGTPNGPAFDRTANPDVVMHPSSDGRFGPGINVTLDANAATVYAHEPNATALYRAIENSSLSDAQKKTAKEIADFRYAAFEQVGQLKRDLAAIESGRETFLSFLGAKTDRVEQTREMLSEAVRDLAEADELLTNLGIKTEASVLPVHIRVTKAFDVRPEKKYTVRSRPIREIVNHLRSQGFDEAALDRALARAPERMDGEQAYDWLAGLMGDELGGDAAGRAALNETLAELGYDGLRATTSRPGPNGRSIAADTAVVFDSSGVKHIDADEFNWLDDRMFYDIVEPANLSGSTIAAALSTDAPLNRRLGTPLLGALSNAGVPAPVTGLVRKLLRMEPGAEAAAAQFSAPLQLRSNSSRLREDGAHWLADWISPKNGTGYFERHASELSGKLVPIWRDMSKLPDAGAAKEWVHGLKFRGKIAQPKSFDRIVHAMRRGDHSKLSADERAIYERIRSLFHKEIEALRKAGVTIAEIKNYFPQVWDVEKLRRNSDAARAKLAAYFKDEALNDPSRSPISDEQALATADQIINKLLDDDGVFLPNRGETRSPQSDHVDYQRMIRLHDPLFRKHLDALEEYLQSDLKGLMAKYFDGTTRRIQFNQKFGVNNHGFYDYQHVRNLGVRGAAELLSRDKVFLWDRKVPTDEGIAILSFQSHLIGNLMNEFQAQDAAAEALRLVRAGEVAAARDYLLAFQKFPTDTWAKRVDAIVNALNDFKGKPRASGNTAMKFTEGVFKSLQRKPFDTGPFHEGSLTASKYLRNFNSVTLLGFTTLTSLPDTALPLIRSGSLKSTLNAWKQLAADPIYRQAIQNVGASIENIVHQNYAQLYGSSMSRSTGAFFNAIGLTPWTNIQRDAASAVGYESFKAEARRMQRAYKPGAQAQNKAFREAKRYLDAFGLSEYGMPGAPSLEDVSVLERDPRVRAAMHKFANESIFAPNQNDIPLWAQSPWGAVVFQLKSYPLMMGRLSKHVINEARQGNVAPLVYMATIGSGLGAGALAVKDVVQGRGGEDNREHALRDRSAEGIAKALGFDPSLHKDVDTFLGWYAESFAALGGLGMIAELLYNTAAQTDNGAWGFQRAASYLFGPSVGLAGSAWNVIGGVATTATGEHANYKERAAVRAIAERVPVLGGLRSLREGATDAIAGPSESGGGGGGRGFGDAFANSGFGEGFGS